MRRRAFRWAGAGSVLAVVAAACAGYRFGVRPGIVGEAQRVEEELARLATPASAGRDAPSGPDAGEAAVLAGELRGVGERVAALRGTLATAGEAEAVLESLGAAASAAGIRFLRFAPEPGYRLDGYLASAVSIVAEGAFVDFLGFFDAVSLSPHLVLMEEVAFERTPGDLLQCRFVAVTMRAVEDSVTGGAGPEEPPPGSAAR